MCIGYDAGDLYYDDASNLEELKVSICHATNLEQLKVRFLSLSPHAEQWDE